MSIRYCLFFKIVEGLAPLKFMSSAGQTISLVPAVVVHIATTMAKAFFVVLLLYCGGGRREGGGGAKEEEWLEEGGGRRRSQGGGVGGGGSWRAGAPEGWRIGG